MSYFLQSGDRFSPAPSKEALLDGLPPGLYTLEETPSGWVFKRGEAFSSLPELYGDLRQKCKRVLTTFAAREGNTGVLLSGERGSGKSLLGRLISRQAAEEFSMPTILINYSVPGEVIGEMLGHLTTPALVFMDEFEKVFHRHNEQEAFLGVLDGVHRSRHLFLLTVNDTLRLDRHLTNRPGRLYYHFKFSGLAEEFVEEYCVKNLDRQEWVEEVKFVAAYFSSFNFDMLKALVEEVNRFGESPKEAVTYLNISPEHSEEFFTVAMFTVEGEVLPPDACTYVANPLSIDDETFYVEFGADSSKLPEGYSSGDSFPLRREDLSFEKSSPSKFVFETKRGSVIFTRKQTNNQPAWNALF